MNPSGILSKISRGVAVLVTALSLSALPIAPAHASAEPGVHDYIECRVVQRGMGCGFHGIFPTGSWNVLFRYRDSNGKVQTEFDGGTCTSASCEDPSYAVPRLDRIPLGYDVYTSAPIVVTGRFVRF